MRRAYFYALFVPLHFVLMHLYLYGGGQALEYALVELALNEYIRAYLDDDKTLVAQAFVGFVDHICEGKKLPNWMEYFDYNGYSNLEVDTINMLMDGILIYGVELPWQLVQIHEHGLLRAYEQSLSHILAERCLPREVITPRIQAMRVLALTYLSEKSQIVWDTLLREDEFVPLPRADRKLLVKAVMLMQELKMPIKLDNNQLSTIMIWKLQMDS